MLSDQLSFILQQMTAKRNWGPAPKGWGLSGAQRARRNDGHVSGLLTINDGGANTGLWSCNH